MSCCPSESWPSLTTPETYTPKGSLQTVPSPSNPSPLPIYLSLPATPNGHSLLVFPEIYGWSGRLKGICDHFASLGYVVILPDIFRGTTGDNKGEKLMDWIREYPWDAHCKNDLDSILEYTSSTYDIPVHKTGSIGFCWGAWFNAKALSCGYAFFAAVGAHPSVKLEEFAFERSQEEMFER